MLTKARQRDGMLLQSMVIQTRDTFATIFLNTDHTAQLITTAAGLSCIFLTQHTNMLRARLSSTVVKGNSRRVFWIAVATLWWVQPQQSPQGFRHRDQPTSGAGNQSSERAATLLCTYQSPHNLPAMQRQVRQAQTEAWSNWNWARW